MIRCKYIIRAYNESKILDNVRTQAEALKSNLSELKAIRNYRSQGLIIGFDLTTAEERDRLVKRLYENGLICNSTGQKSIRLRPNLAISEIDTTNAIDIIKKSLGEL